MIYLRPQSGFSLIETLVAITILLLVIVGPLTITTSASRSTSFGSEQVVAYLLAQEGAELVQKVRDDYLLEAFAGSPNNAWTTFTRTSAGNPAPNLSSCFSTGCGLSLSDLGELNTPVACSGVSDCFLRLDNTSADRRSNYFHGTSGGTVTPFRRSIRLTRSGDEVAVVSTVSWRSGLTAVEQSVSVETRLFNVYGI